MPTLNELVAQSILRNSLLDWLLAFALAIASFGGLLIARRFVRRSHARLAQTPQTELMELPLAILSRTSVLFFIAVSLFAGLATLTMGPKTAALLQTVVTIAIFYQAGLWGTAAAGALIERKRRRSLETDRALVGSLGIIQFILRLAIWTVVVLLVLENVGVDVTALVAGLGIGGIAVALAVQNILGDLFASLSITFDRPFSVGDFLIIDGFLGSVEHIGLKSTRLRSLSGEQIIMSNADLLGSRVRNYGRMMERRVVFTLRVAYGTPVDLLERIPKMIREIVTAQQNTRFDRSHFAKHLPEALEFETVYYVLSPDYNQYMDIQQAINLRIHREFERLGIEFAYPTQKLFIARAPQHSTAAA